MPELPFNIPESLFSYVEQYEHDPEKTTRRLQKQLKKRGHDAVGYFLLAWFHHKHNQKEKALECAVKAKTFAPGSPFFKKVHYFFAHPDLFNAWSASASTHNPSAQDVPSTMLDNLELDLLIDKLSTIDGSRMPVKMGETKSEGSSYKDTSEDFDDIVSETLASIHEQQGNLGAATQAYKRLQHIHPDKKEHYKKQLKRLEKLKKQQK